MNCGDSCVQRRFFPECLLARRSQDRTRQRGQAFTSTAGVPSEELNGSFLRRAGRGKADVDRVTKNDCWCCMRGTFMKVTQPGADQFA